MALSIIDRLNEKTVKDKLTECWIFIGGNDGHHGYGKIRFNGKKERVNRVSACLFLRLDLNDITLQALHKKECLSKKCWNPKHLYIGTRRDNARDAIELSKYKNRKVGKQHELTNFFCVRSKK